MIDCHQLRKVFKEELAVDGVSFELAAGEICGLLGKNGAGKTTTMRCLAGLIPATAGDIRVAGCDVSGDLIELKRRVAFVPDDPPLFDDLTVGEHLDLIGRLYRVPNYPARARMLLEQFELDNKYHAGATTLSRGMRQKLAICCAYLFEPEVLLLDEPLTGLDPPGIRTLLASVREAASRGVAVVISSHLLAMIEDVCSHWLVLDRGQVRFFGTTKLLNARFPDQPSLEDAYFAAIAQANELSLQA
jgi:ABC-2 type transport system ATP-binding protein